MRFLFKVVYISCVNLNKQRYLVYIYVYRKECNTIRWSYVEGLKLHVEQFLSEVFIGDLIFLSKIAIYIILEQKSDVPFNTRLWRTAKSRNPLGLGIRT